MPLSLPRLARGVAGALSAAGLLACDLSTGPQIPQNPIDIAIDFCANDVPVWFAYENLGQPTTRVLPDANGTFRFTANNRVVIGMVWQSGADYDSEFIYASNEELEAMSGRECQEEVGTTRVNGTIAGASAAQVVAVGMGVSSAALTGGNTSYSLLNLPNRPLDLLASRQNTDGLTRIADRIVLRRTQTFANNGNVPLIDFGAGGDAVAAATANATVSGIFTDDFAFIQNNFISQLGTSHSLFYSEDIFNGTHQFAAVPSTSLAAGDYHDLILLSVDQEDGSVRGVENFFRGTSAQTMALGPALETPSITVIPNSEYVRLRMSLPTQQSYNDAVSVVYLQQQSASVTRVRMWATIGWLRQVVNAWLIDIPDLTGAQGWQDAWGLKPGLPIEWTATAYGGRSVLTMGALPEHGEFIRYAIRQSESTVAGLSAGMRQAPTVRSVPRVFSRRR